MKSNTKSNVNLVLFWLITLLCTLGYYWLSFETDRSNFTQVIALYSGLFLAYALFIQFWNENVKLIIGLGILFRIVALLSFPNLSDDIYRFLWDGSLSIKGINPFLNIPSDIASHNSELFENLNSKEYYSIYPPVLQYLFAFASFLFPKNIHLATLVLKGFIFLAEAGTIALLLKLFNHYKIHAKNIGWYALNPLVIIELCGNSHFEALMIFFTLLSIWWLVKQKNILSSVAMSLAICSKLLPLMFLPFLIKRLGVKESLKYFLIIGLVCLFLFAPFISKELFQNLFTSIDLYFRKFEFNASIFYLIRWIGFQIKGWNIIETAGPILSIATTLSILMIAFRERTSTIKSLLPKMSVMLLIFFGLATIVHPWYITTLVAFTTFWKWRFPIVWSALIPLSYFAYSNTNYTESLWLIALEYSIIPLFAFYEWRKGWNEDY